MAITYEPIATTTLGSAAASITFSSISSAYTDLRVVMVTTAAASGGYLTAQFNSDTGTNYSSTYLYGNGTTASSGRSTSSVEMFVDTVSAALSTSNPSLITMDIFSYAGSTFKTTLSTGSNDFNGSGEIDRGVSLWRSTAAITAIKLLCNVNLAAGTTATLYGIKAA